MRGKKIIFTSEQEKEIVRLYESKLMNTQQIGEIFKISGPVVLRLLRKQDINTGLGNRKKKLYAKGDIEVWNKNKKGLQVSPIKNKTYEEYYGDKKAKEIKEKLHNFRQDKTLEEIYGIEKAREIRRKIGLMNKDKKFTERHKLNLSKSNKGKLAGVNHPRYGVKGKNNPLYGKHTSLITEFKKGENHPFFNNWSSFEPYGIEFNKGLKEKIRERDNHTCQECGEHQKELKRLLHAHHIDYNKKNNSIWNLISLCNRCHAQTTTCNRKHWKEHFQMKMFIKEFFNPENLLVFNESKQLVGMERIK